MASCIKIINAFLKWFAQEHGKDNNPIEFGVYKDVEILKFWKKHNVYWAVDQSKFGMEDEWFHYPLDIADWLEVYYNYATACPSYTPNTKDEAGFDCDDFADGFPVWCKMFSSHLLGKTANATWEVWGDTPEGGHAWNAVMTEEGMYEIEPQTGEVWVFGTNPSYKAILAK